jgi:hypothetical protein
MAVDANNCELVSAIKYPATRENAGNFVNFVYMNGKTPGPKLK